MSRWFTALPRGLALVALSIFAASCGSSTNPAQARFVNAIPDTTQYGTALDIDVNGTKQFTGVAFQGVQPPSGYTSIPSGGGTFKGLKTATSTEVFIANVSLDPAKQYTLVATGFATGVSKVPILATVDNNTTAASGDVEFRVINASPSAPPGVDIYIIPIGSGTTLTPPATITNLAYKSTSSYAKLPYNPNVVNGANYTMFVTATGTTSPILITQTLSAGSASAGAVRTLVLTDQENVNQLNQRAIVLNDLN